MKRIGRFSLLLTVSLVALLGAGASGGTATPPTFTAIDLGTLGGRPTPMRVR